VIRGKLTLGIGDGILKADGTPIYKVNGMKVGLFTDNAGMQAA
jgi:3-hydroxyacyl-[acyl-carrier protein] dehydratase / trans-2-decenoyl-[acyl-carrier protein] isomerase